MNRIALPTASIAALLILVGQPSAPANAQDHVRDLQQSAMTAGRTDWGFWGLNPEKYADWSSHSNRLIPVYTFGLSLDPVRGAASPYRDETRIESLYGCVPDGTLNPTADYFDQTDVARLQELAVAMGKKYVILIVFDGMDWQTTQAASIVASGRVAYRDGRGMGLAFQDYRGAETDFGYCVTSPYTGDCSCDPDAQVVIDAPARARSGYDASLGGDTPWTGAADPTYLIGRSERLKHDVTDSSSSATSLTAGIKTYNGAINVDSQGRPVEPLTHRLQRLGYAIGVVTSVPISHATPACAYAQGVSRDDFQDLTRDLIGLPSATRRATPLDGVDVLLGAGWGYMIEKDPDQGTNFVAGNRYITDADLRRIDLREGGRYRVVVRTPGVAGGQALEREAAEAADQGQRLFGMFGYPSGHLPFQTADGAYDPTAGAKYPLETYAQADLDENPTLAQLTSAALTVLERDPDGFWLMVEAGDVDWANHDNNIDSSIGAVLSGDSAFRVVAEWAEKHDRWRDTAVILTSDHGHYLHLARPEALLPSAAGR